MQFTKVLFLLICLLCGSPQSLFGQALESGIKVRVLGSANPFIEVPAGTGRLVVEFTDAIVQYGPSGNTSSAAWPDLTGIRLGSPVTFNMNGPWYISANSTHSSPVVNPPVGRYYFAARDSGPTSGIGYEALVSYAIKVTLTEKAPAITAQPLSRTVAVGGQATFSVTANGTNLRYQWRKNGVNIGGANASTYTINNVQSGDAATYSVVVSNDGGNASSSDAVLTVTSAPQITSHPVSLTRNVGQSATFTVTATGLPAPTYQWRKDGTNISGATSASYTINSVTASHAAAYTVVVSNTTTSVTSQIAQLTVITRPQITAQPQGVSRMVGQSVTFGVSASGSPTLTYQWRKNGTNIGGATSNSYTISSVTSSDAASYSVVVANAAGSVTSNGAYLTVAASPSAPSIISHPQSLTRVIGESATFSVTASGNPTPTYQWQKDGQNIAGANSSSYAIASVTTADEGAYTVRVSNSQGVLNSNSAALTISSDPNGELTIFIEPEAARNSGARWSVDGGNTWNISGATRVLPIGDYTVSFLSGLGYTGAQDVPISISDGSSEQRSVTFSKVIENTGNVLMGMGNNEFGQLGFGPSSPQSLPEWVDSNVTVVSAGRNHTLFIKSDGTLWGMGSNSFGQLGDGTTIDRSEPILIATNVSQAVAGYNHSMFVKTDHTMWAMGSNSAGAFGDGTTTSRISPVQVGSNVAKVATGYNHSYFLKTDGSLWGVGQNTNGQLGDGTITNRLTPIRIATDVAQVAAGGYHSLFVKTDGSLWATGANFQGQLGDHTTTTRRLPVQIMSNVTSVDAGAYHTSFITADRALWYAGGYRSSPTRLMEDVERVATGGDKTLFIKTDKTLWEGGLKIAEGVTHVSVGEGHQMFIMEKETGSFSINLEPLEIRAAGARWSVDGGKNWLESGQTVFLESEPKTVIYSDVEGFISPPSSLVQVSSQQKIRWNRSYFRKYSTGMAAGGNTYGQLGDGTLVNRKTHVMSNFNVKQVAAGGGYSISYFENQVPGGPHSNGVSGNEESEAWSLHLKNDGALWGVGLNSHGQLGDGTTINKEDHIEIDSDVTQVAAGFRHTLYIKNDGDLWAMGWNVYGQLGDGTLIDRSSPVKVATDVVKIAAGHSHSLFIKRDGSLWAMGYNISGQLGDGSIVNRNKPVMVASDVVKISAGYMHSLFVKTSGDLWITRRREPSDSVHNPVQVGTGVSQISAGHSTSYYVTQDRSLWSFSGYYGTHSFVSSDVEKVSSGGYQYTVRSSTWGVGSRSVDRSYAMFIKSDGGLWALGDNEFGLLGDGTTINRTLPVKIRENVTDVAVGSGHSLFIIPAKEGGELSVNLGQGEFWGQWSVDGGKSWYLSGGRLGLATGSYTITFADVNGYVSPAPIQVQIANGDVVNLSRSYTKLVEGLAQFQEVVRNAGLVGEDADPTAEPHGDGVANLLKYAFNMNLAGPDSRYLASGSGIAGLPVITLERSGAAEENAGVLKIEYLRRRDSGLTYTPEVSSLLANNSEDSWLPAGGTPEIIQINEEWERVIVRDETNAVSYKRFARVRVEMPGLSEQ